MEGMPMKPKAKLAPPAPEVPRVVPSLNAETIERYGIPDSKPGNYYVSAEDNGTVWFLLGPLPSHATAIAMIRPVRNMAVKGNPLASFYAFGTLRVNDGENLTPGSANKYFPEAFAMKEAA